MIKTYILNFIAELLTCESYDKKYQKRLIDNLVKRVIVSDGFFSVVATLKGRPKLYTDSPEVVESEIQRIKELVEFENKRNTPIIAHYVDKASKCQCHSSANEKCRILSKGKMRFIYVLRRNIK